MEDYINCDYCKRELMGDMRVIVCGRKRIDGKIVRGFAKL